MDTIFGATVFEYKSDLRAEEGDVLSRLPDYLRERERQTGRRYTSALSRTARSWRAYELRAGALHEVGRRLKLDPGDPEALIGLLEPALADRDDLAPEPAAVQGALGRHSFVFGYAASALARLWDRHRTDPEAALKRDLWDALLREVYGQRVGDDALFLQHTYLTVVAKTIAAAVLDMPADDAAAVLSGELLAENNIYGAVESDFSDWVLLDFGRCRPRAADSRARPRGSACATCRRTCSRRCTRAPSSRCSARHAGARTPELRPHRLTPGGAGLLRSHSKSVQHADITSPSSLLIP